MPPLSLRAARIALREARAADLAAPQPARATAFSGAVHNRLTQDWIFAGARSADGDVRGDLQALRRRAREMTRNNPHARRFKSLLAENVIGPHGVTLQGRVERNDGELDETINTRIEDAYKRWCKKGQCTADRKMSFTEVCHLYMETLGTDGEVLLRLLPGFPNEFGFAVQVLDPDLLDDSFNRSPAAGVPEIRMGVEMDEWGAPLAYHLWSSHPSDGPARTRNRIPAEQIIHDYLVERPGQTRGVSWFAPVMFRARMLHGFEEAAVIAARVGAAKVAAWIPNADAPPPMLGEEPDAVPMDAEPGSMLIGPRGHTLAEWDPTYPNIEFAGFSKSVLRSIAAGLRCSYNLLASDLEGVNYSSLREGKLSEREVWKLLQRRFIDTVLDRIYPLWLKWAITTGALSLPARYIARWESHVWQPRGWAWVDPFKDLQAAELGIALGVNSRTRVCAEGGVEFAEVARELAREQKIARELGITLEAKPAAPAPAPAPARGDDEEGDVETKASSAHVDGTGNRLAGALNGEE